MTDDQTVQTAETKPVKPSFFSIPGNPRIPALVRAYGTIIRMANILMIVLSALMFFGGAAGNAPGLIVGAIVQAGISGILIWVGGVLRNGKKAGVHAVTVLAGLEVLGGLWLATYGGALVFVVVLVGVSIILGPPIIVGYKNWDKFD